MPRCVAIFRSSLLLCLSWGTAAVAEDLKLVDGQTFRNVRVLEVRPDALIVWHRDGVVMADIESLPKTIQARYKLDARKAAAFRVEEESKRRAEAEENRRLIAEYESRKVATAGARMNSTGGEKSSFAGFDKSELTYRPGASERAYDSAVADISEEIAQTEEVRRLERQKPDTFWNAPFWKNPVVTFIGSLFGAGRGGHVPGGDFNSEPRGWH